MRSRAVGIVLTGMGDDGTEGARAVALAGGVVIAESEETAVINGMPGSARRAGVVSHSLPIHAIAELVDELLL
jgi:two-component system chemotaxis response regulator CheB